MAKMTPEQQEKKRWTKLRSAIRNVWQYDPLRKAVITQASYKGVQSITIPADEKGTYFQCPLCKREWPIELATVDHEPELGGFSTWDEFFKWTTNCFFGPQRAICKPCHKRKPKPKKGVKNVR